MTIQLSNISKSYNIQRVLEDVTLQIVPKGRIGLIGKNGSGKSTLLKIITRQTEPDGGAISQTPGTRVAYLSQEPKITPGLTLYEEMKDAFTYLAALQREEETLIKQLEDPNATEDEQMAYATRFSEVHEALERLDVRDVDAKIGRILKGLGFTQADHDRQTTEFSGGWQMRINLAKILLDGADVILLDEPTNHLDLEACEWLENFLREYPGGLVIVSHDRHFLDAVVTDIAELEYGKLRVWAGNYSHFLVQKEEEIENLTAAHERQQKDLAKQQAFVDRFRASATRSTQAKSREKQLEKIERIELPQHDKRRVSFRFPPPKQSGLHVLNIRNVAKSFGDKHLFAKLDAEIQRDQRVFLLGANGCGKTTLLRLILGIEKPDTGEVKYGHHTQLAYFSQNQLDTLDPKKDLFDTIQEANPKLTNTEIRTLLGRFLLSGDQVFKPVGVLSGGEKSKVALAKMMVSGPNTLLLDEPTNHIDIQTKDVMTEALQDYEGTILCISHDRYFIQQLATEIWELYNGHLISYCGDYEYYLSKRDEMRAKIDNQKKPSASKVAAVPEPIIEQAKINADSQIDFKAKKEAEKQFKKVEKQIVQLEVEIATLQEQLADPMLQDDYQKLQQVSDAIGSKQRELAALTKEWESLAEALA